jgi:hypothetical protein
MERSELENAGANWIVRNCADIAARSDGDGLLVSLAL